MNALDILILAVLAVVVFFALRKTLSAKGSCSCGSCSGNCSTCGANCSHCTQRKKKP